MLRKCLALLALVTGLGPASAAPLLPDFSAATFVNGAPVDNPYFPLLDTRTRIYVDVEVGMANRFEHQVIGPGRVLLGVQTTTLRDRSYEDGLLVEDTFDYFAQDTAGNVWYFGEDVTNYHYDDDGNLIGTDTASSWLAGRNLANPGGDPAQPGYIMPVPFAPVGFEYYQEYAVEDEALDVGQVNGYLPRVRSGIGVHRNVLQIFETNALDADAREFKYYAPGIGLVKVEEGLDASFMNPEATFVLMGIVPEPQTWALFGLGLAGLAFLRRRQLQAISALSPR